ncbi:MAG: ribonuclease HII [Nanoarchaeota archaeon]
MKLICGIDDAGRGPVIGPMIIAGIIIEEREIEKLKEIGVKDSKLLSPKQREEIYKKIIKLVKDYKIIKIPPKEIDAAILSGRTNLNWLEADHMAEIINYLKPEKTIVDCPSNNISKFSRYMESKINVNTSLKCDHKAERFYPVGAASILAKVTRDGEIEKIQKMIPYELGSGYPSDPITKKFLKEHGDKYPDIFRKTWSTYINHKEAKKQKSLKDF